MLKQSFLSKDNVKLVWEILLEEEILKSNSNAFVNEIYEIFIKNVQSFYENESDNCNDLMTMNKKYIMLILRYIESLLYNKEQMKNKITERNTMINSSDKYNKIKIYNNTEPPPIQVKELVTFEDIQNNKNKEFEKSLNKHLEDFQNSMSIKTPDVPNFAITLNDGPITEIDKKIKEMTRQRNYDIEQINKTLVHNTMPNNWLSSTETSIKSEKITNDKITNDKITNDKITNDKIINDKIINDKITNKNVETSSNERPFTQIKIDNNNIDNLDNRYRQEIIDINATANKNNKHIRWEDDSNPNGNNDINPSTSNELNIFNKLKKINTNNTNINNMNTNDYTDINIVNDKVTVIQNDIVKLNNKLNDIYTSINTILEIINNK